MKEITMEELKQRKIWMLWRRKESDGRVAKIPCTAKGKACGTSSDYEKDWVTYQEAKQALNKIKADGIGFKIPEGMFFLDIDHRDLQDPEVQEILNSYDSYCEYSVSGAGIHIYGICDVSKLPIWTDPRDKKRKLAKEYYVHHPENGLELYIGDLTNRFAVFTENIIRDGKLRDCTGALLDTLNRHMRRPSSSPIADKKAERIIQELRNQKNGAKFSKLFDTGVLEGCKSQSEADAALCAVVAFRAGDDAALIDAIFRQSALYRPKWDRADYREQTIRKGIEVAQRRKAKKKDVPAFIIIDEKDRKSVSAPLLAKHIRENMRYILVRDSGTQTAMKYVYENGVYKIYDLNMLYGAIKRFIEEYDETLVKMSTIKEAAQLILSDLDYLSQDDLNSDESVINFQNGLLRVTEDELTLLPHSPEVLSTIQLPCCWYDHEIPTPVFDRYMETLTNGNAEVKQLLLEFMGMAISNVQGWRTKKSLFLVGDGNTGKSQLKSLTERLLGKGNFIGIDLSEIEARFGTGAIYGKRLAGSSDMSFMSISELKTFKRISGGDSLYMEFKGQQPFEATFHGLLWFCMNKLPKFSGDTGRWVFERILVVDCPNVIPPEKQDKQLLDKMYAEKEGIVQKCVVALQAVIKNGYKFIEPECVLAARAAYQETNSTVITFFEECMCPWPEGKIGGSSITTGTIHKVYLQWCKVNNNGYAKSAKEFRDELSAHLGTTFPEMTTRQHGNTYYKDWTLTEDAQTDYNLLLQRRTTGS